MKELISIFQVLAASYKAVDLFSLPATQFLKLLTRPPQKNSCLYGMIIWS